MKSNNTQLIKYKTGRPESRVLTTNRKKFSSNLPGDYSMMLQLYCLNKQQTLPKKELTYVKLTPNAVAKTKPKRLLSIPVRLAAFFTTNFAVIKKVKQGIALVTE